MGVQIGDITSITIPVTHEKGATPSKKGPSLPRHKSTMLYKDRVNEAPAKTSTLSFEILPEEDFPQNPSNRDARQYVINLATIFDTWSGAFGTTVRPSVPTLLGKESSAGVELGCGVYSSKSEWCL